jgi:hypothetical protein
MTKKDYKLIATAIKTALDETKDSPEYFQAYLINTLVTALHRDNPKFDTYKFRQACGVTVGGQL